MNFNSIQIGSKVSLFGERNRFVVRCKGNRYIVLSKKFFKEERCAVIDSWSDLAIMDNKHFKIKNNSEIEFLKLLDKLESGDLKFSFKNIENISNLNSNDFNDLKYPIESYLNLSIMPAFMNSKDKVVKCRIPHECCICGNIISENSYSVCRIGFIRNIGRVSAYLCCQCAEHLIEIENSIGVDDE